MRKTGHIEIKDNKVVFVYYELPEPIELCKKCWKKVWEEYQTSKREVEVENVVSTKAKTVWIFDCENVRNELFGIIIKNGMPCEAEVNGKAVITKIT